MEAVGRQIADEAAKLEQRSDQHTKLEEYVPKFQREQEALERKVKQLDERHAQVDDKAAELETKQQEAERLRAEQKGKSVWQRIWDEQNGRLVAYLSYGMHSDAFGLAGLIIRER